MGLPVAETVRLLVNAGGVEEDCLNFSEAQLPLRADFDQKACGTVMTQNLFARAEGFGGVIGLTDGAVELVKASL